MEREIVISNLKNAMKAKYFKPPPDQELVEENERKEKE